MSTTGAILTAFGEGSIVINFYGNDDLPSDSQEVIGTKSGLYKWSINPIRLDVQKYSFSVENRGFMQVQVNYGDTTYTLTNDVHKIAFGMWNVKTFVPTKTSAPPSQHVGGITLLEQP